MLYNYQTWAGASTLYHRTFPLQGLHHPSFHKQARDGTFFLFTSLVSDRCQRTLPSHSPSSCISPPSRAVSERGAASRFRVRGRGAPQLFRGTEPSGTASSGGCGRVSLRLPAGRAAVPAAPGVAPPAPRPSAGLASCCAGVSAAGPAGSGEGGSGSGPAGWGNAVVADELTSRPGASTWGGPSPVPAGSGASPTNAGRVCRANPTERA